MTEAPVSCTAYPVALTAVGDGLHDHRPSPLRICDPNCDKALQVRTTDVLK
jgi:hypothetical protein